MKVRVLDIETTQINPQIKFNIENDQICEIAITQLDTKTGEIIPVYQTLCRGPEPPSPNSWIFKHSNIKLRDIENAQTICSLKKEIQPILDQGFPVTAYNQNYDFPRLEHPKHGFNIPNKFWDPLKILVPITRIPSRFGYKYPTLQEAHNHLFPEEPYTCDHRALDDSTIPAKIILKLIQIKPSLETSTPNWVKASALHPYPLPAKRADKIIRHRGRGGVPARTH